MKNRIGIFKHRILERAQDLHIRRAIWHPGPHQLNLYHRTVRYDDLTAAARLVQGEDEKQRMRYLVNRLARQTRRGSVSAHWFLPLDSISYAGIDVAADDAAEKLYVSAFPCAAPHRSVIYRTTVNLTRMREITQDLAALFGLRLPVSWKKQAHTMVGDKLGPEPHFTTSLMEGVSPGSDCSGPT